MGNSQSLEHLQGADQASHSALATRRSPTTPSKNALDATPNHGGQVTLPSRQIGSQETLSTGFYTPLERPAIEAVLDRILHPENGERVDVTRLAAVLQEIRNRASPEELSILQQALYPNATKENAVLHDPNSAPFEYRGAVTPRKSLLRPPPGTATRSKVQKLKKNPSNRQANGRDASKSKTWSPEDFTASPLSAIAGLGSISAGAGELSERPRGSLDLEWTNIGTMKHGTLRITNGAATPEPSIRSGLQPPPRPVLPQSQDDYFTCSEGNGDSASLGNLSTDDTGSTLSVEGAPATPTAKPRFHTDRLSRKPQQRLAVSPIASRRAAQRFVPTESPREERSLDVFELYAQEAMSNPFGSIEAGEDQIKTNEQAGHTNTLEQPHAGQVSDEDSRVTLSAEHPPVAQESSTSHETDGQSSEKGPTTPLVPAPMLHAGDTGANPADGNHYTSTRPVEQRQQPRRARTSQPDLHFSTLQDEVQHDVEPSSSRTMARELSLVTRGLDTLPGNVRQAEEMRRAARSARPGYTGFQAIGSSPMTPEKGPFAPFATENAGFKSNSTADLTMPLASTPTEISPGCFSLPTSAEKPKKRNRLQKKRLFRGEGADIQVTNGVGSPLQDVPAIPTEIVENHSNRMSRFPNMEHLDHTFDSVSAVGAREPSPERPSARPEVRFPSPPEFKSGIGASADDRGRRRSSIGPGTSPSRLMRSLSRHRRPSRAEIDPVEVIDHDIIGVSDFGDVPEIVFASPYDVVSRARLRPREEEQAKAVEPTKRQSRPRPTTGMDDRTASDLARRRSRDRLGYMRSEDGEHPGGGATKEDVPPLPRLPKIGGSSRPMSWAGPEQMGMPQHEDRQASAGADDVRDRVWAAQAEFWRQRGDQTAPRRPPPPTPKLEAPGSTAEVEGRSGGARSPSPSVKERAAFFEMAARAAHGDTRSKQQQQPAWPPTIWTAR